MSKQQVRVIPPTTEHKVVPVEVVAVVVEAVVDMDPAAAVELVALAKRKKTLIYLLSIKDWFEQIKITSPI